MVLPGQLWKDGNYWLIEVPSLDLVTQGRTRREALTMIKEAIELHVDKKGFQIKLKSLNKNEFVVSSNKASYLVALVLKRQRQLQGLSIQEVADRLHYQSKTAYAQYETGKHLPGLEKLSAFLSAIRPNLTLSLDLLNH